jgi:hypothetical protein
MPRHYAELFQGTFTGGWTGALANRQFSVTRMEDALITSDEYVYPRGDLATVLTLPNGEIPRYGQMFRQKTGPFLAVIASTANVYIYEVDSLDNFTLKLTVPRSSNTPVSAIYYQSDIFFTVDRALRYYDPETDTSRAAQLPQATGLTADLEDEGNIRGTVSYLIVYRRQDGTRREVEGVSSDVVSIETFGSGVRLDWDAPPGGIGITHTRIYRAQVDAGVVRPYVRVADVDVGTTTYLDQTALAELGSALSTLGRTLPGGDLVEEWLDHLFVAYDDYVYISTAFRPEVFEPGLDLAFDEGRASTGVIRQIVRAKDRVLIAKNDAIYEIRSQGSPQIPWSRETLTDEFGSDSTLGIAEVGDGQVIIGSSTEIRGGSQNILGPLQAVYEKLPASARQNLALTYFPEESLVAVCLTGETWVYQRTGWSKWNAAATVPMVLKTDGADRLYLAMADGTIRRHDRGNRKAAQLRAVHTLTAAGSTQANARLVVMRCKGSGVVGMRVVALDTEMVSPWQWRNINTKDDDRPVSVSAPMHAIGKVLALDIVLDGNVGVGLYQVMGIPGRQVIDEIGRNV